MSRVCPSSSSSLSFTLLFPFPPGSFPPFRCFFSSCPSCGPVELLLSIPRRFSQKQFFDPPLHVPWRFFCLRLPIGISILPLCGFFRATLLFPRQVGFRFFVALPGRVFPIPAARPGFSPAVFFLFRLFGSFLSSSSYFSRREFFLFSLCCFAPLGPLIGSFENLRLMTLIVTTPKVLSASFSRSPPASRL